MSKLHPLNNDYFVLNVEYCRSCDSHNWCTHHDEQKYLNTFNKLKQYLMKEYHGQIIVQGNVIPEDLVPIKKQQNKFMNVKTNKYVTFPNIGAFEIRFQNQLLYSKKKTNAWPNFAEISDKVFEKLNGKTRKQVTLEEQRAQSADVDILTEKDNISLKNPSFLDHNDKRTTFHKQKHNTLSNKKNNINNFTLTDHFKNYHRHKNRFQSNKDDEQNYFVTDNDIDNQTSDRGSFRTNSTEFMEFKRNFQEFGIKNKLNQFIKKKGYFHNDSGKKEMIIKLDSIQEESIVMEDTYKQNIKNATAQSFNKSTKSSKKAVLLKQFADEFDQLQAKLKNFQQKVQTIREQNKKFDSMPKINQRFLSNFIPKQHHSLNKNKRKLRDSELSNMKNNLLEQEQDMQDILNNPIMFARRKLKNIQDYINGTEDEKNEKLKKIYGEWKLLKKPFKSKNSNYVSPYKIDLANNLLANLGNNGRDKRVEKKSKEGRLNMNMNKNKNMNVLKNDQIDESSSSGNQSAGESNNVHHHDKGGLTHYKSAGNKLNFLRKLPKMPQSVQPKQLNTSSSEGNLIFERKSNNKNRFFQTSREDFHNKTMKSKHMNNNNNKNKGLLKHNDNDNNKQEKQKYKNQVNKTEDKSSLSFDQGQGQGDKLKSWNGMANNDKKIKSKQKRLRDDREKMLGGYDGEIRQNSFRLGEEEFFQKGKGNKLVKRSIVESNKKKIGKLQKNKQMLKTKGKHVVDNQNQNENENEHEHDNINNNVNVNDNDNEREQQHQQNTSKPSKSKLSTNKHNKQSTLGVVKKQHHNNQNSIKNQNTMPIQSFSESETEHNKLDESSKVNNMNNRSRLMDGRTNKIKSKAKQQDNNDDMGYMNVRLSALDGSQDDGLVQGDRGRGSVNDDDDNDSEVELISPRNVDTMNMNKTKKKIKESQDLIKKNNDKRTELNGQVERKIKVNGTEEREIYQDQQQDKNKQSAYNNENNSQQSDESEKQDQSSDENYVENDQQSSQQLLKQLEYDRVNVQDQQIIGWRGQLENQKLMVREKVDDSSGLKVNRVEKKKEKNVRLEESYDQNQGGRIENQGQNGEEELGKEKDYEQNQNENGGQHKQSQQQKVDEEEKENVKMNKKIIKKQKKNQQDGQRQDQKDGQQNGSQDSQQKQEQKYKQDKTEQSEQVNDTESRQNVTKQKNKKAKNKRMNKQNNQGQQDGIERQEIRKSSGQGQQANQQRLSQYQNGQQKVMNEDIEKRQEKNNGELLQKGNKQDQEVIKKQQSDQFEEKKESSSVITPQYQKQKQKQGQRQNVQKQQQKYDAKSSFQKEKTKRSKVQGQGQGEKQSIKKQNKILKVYGDNNTLENSSNQQQQNQQQSNQQQQNDNDQKNEDKFDLQGNSEKKKVIKKSKTKEKEQNEKDEQDQGQQNQQNHQKVQELGQNESDKKNSNQQLAQSKQEEQGKKQAGQQQLSKQRIDNNNQANNQPKQSKDVSIQFNSENQSMILMNQINLENVLPQTQNRGINEKKLATQSYSQSKQTKQEGRPSVQEQALDNVNVNDNKNGQKNDYINEEDNQNGNNVSINQSNIRSSLKNQSNVINEASDNQSIIFNELQPEQKVTRAPILKQIYGENIEKENQDYLKMKQNGKLTPRGQKVAEDVSNSKLISVKKIFKSSQNHLFNSKSIQPQSLTMNNPLPELFKIINILCQINEFLIIRLFENPFKCSNQQSQNFAVWLCLQHEWKCIVVNDEILLDEKSSKPYYLQHQHDQLWPLILEKCLAVGLGGYDKLSQTPCYKLFNILTGSNSMFFNIKQDPSKNQRILKYISDCENKNFIIHAEKVCRNLQELQRKQKQPKIFYVLSQKIVNGNEILIQMRESTKNSSIWIKLTKFVQEFKSIEILQLRINHNFTYLHLNKPTNTNNITIMQMDFIEESFGSITLSTLSSTNLKTYLYKQEKSNVLKLIGEAKEKNKLSLFFDCFFSQAKYYLFIETKQEAKITYLGENRPILKVIEQVNSEGLKNDYTEYLPIKNIKYENRQQRMPKTMNKNKFGQTMMSFRSQKEDDKISRLRQNFVDYLLQTKNN